MWSYHICGEHCVEKQLASSAVKSEIVLDLNINNPKYKCVFL
jgi:hypothetical protein